MSARSTVVLRDEPGDELVAHASAPLGREDGAHVGGEGVDVLRARVPRAHPAHLAGAPRPRRRSGASRCRRSVAARREDGEDRVGLRRAGSAAAPRRRPRRGQARAPSRWRASAERAPQVGARAGPRAGRTRKRIFEASCACCLRTYAKPSPQRRGAGRRRPRPASSPAFVAAEARAASTPTSVVSAAQADAERGGGVGQPGAVDVQQQPVGVGDVGQRAQLVGRVDACRARCVWVTETTRGCTACSSPSRARRGATELGRRACRPGVGTASSLSPPTRSGAPHSSTCRCAVSAQIDRLPGPRRRAWRREDVGGGAVEDEERPRVARRSARGTSPRRAPSSRSSP